MSHDIVSLFDVDNTLLDNDAVAEALRQHLAANLGEASCSRYWTIFEALRTELGYADYLGALQRYRLEHPDEPKLLETSLYLVDYPFRERLFAHAIEVIRRFQQWGPTVIFSDGDAVFQPRKVLRAGLWDAVDGHVLIYVHKEAMLEAVARRYPAAHYLLIDDKLRILDAVKQIWSSRVTTIFPKQGHYAHDPTILERYPAADLAVDRIGDLLTIHMPLPGGVESRS
jgi:FMN phosphatase YigB (HAD superfamily)